MAATMASVLEIAEEARVAFTTGEGACMGDEIKVTAKVYTIYLRQDTMLNIIVRTPDWGTFDGKLPRRGHRASSYRLEYKWD